MQLIHNDGSGPWDSRRVPAEYRRRVIDGKTYTVSGDLANLPADVLAGMGLSEYTPPAPEPETLAQAQSRRLAEFRAGAAQAIAESVPAPWDSLRDLATLAYAEWVDAFRALVAAELSRLESAVEAAADVAAVNAVAADWPEVTDEG